MKKQGTPASAATQDKDPDSAPFHHLQRNRHHKKSNTTVISATALKARQPKAIFQPPRAKTAIDQLLHPAVSQPIDVRITGRKCNNRDLATIGHPKFMGCPNKEPI
ncbi:hypothetical protein Nepgr_020409 [Nepenthes gracilis]|uniref:Uncharacterized protein n=1 Tax=Nepenthes gracilis TaxID=150966 RepID=A0AAD3XV75_NEPGR|nr:hypothetical protein Nepgr_020409 [Nepenthes gracilis]